MLATSEDGGVNGTGKRRFLNGLSVPVLTFVHGSLIDRLRLQSHVSGGKNEGECGQDDTVNASDNGQRIRPTNATQSRLETIRFRSADLPEIIRVPAEGKGHATDHHADRWNNYEEWVLLIKRGAS